MADNLPTVIHQTRAELEAQRVALLAEAGLPYEELQARAERWVLPLEQLDIWRTIEGVDYLLDDA